MDIKSTHFQNLHEALSEPKENPQRVTTAALLDSILYARDAIGSERLVALLLDLTKMELTKISDEVYSHTFSKKRQKH